MNELKSLMPDTKKVLKKLAGLSLLKEFTFVGGSALSIYLSHRYSEDIDLFTWKEKLDGLSIQEKISEADFSRINILNISQQQADFMIDGVNVTFFDNNWSELQNRKQLFQNLHIAHLDIIAVMKINSLFLRAKFRDYYDLYVLNLQYFSLNQLFEMAKNKIANLNKTLFQKVLIFTEDIEDESIRHMEPKYKISLKEIEHHFTKEIKKWNQ